MHVGTVYAHSAMLPDACGSERWATVAQAWGVLEARAGNAALARQLFKCAVRADPSSEKAWLVRLCTTKPHFLVQLMSLAPYSSCIGQSYRVALVQALCMPNAQCYLLMA